MEANLEAASKTFLQEAKAIQKKFSQCWEMFQIYVDSEDRRYNDFLIRKKDSENTLKQLKNEIQTIKFGINKTADEIKKYDNEEKIILMKLPQLKKELDQKYVYQTKLMKISDELEKRANESVKLRAILQSYKSNNEHFGYIINVESLNVYQITFTNKDAEINGFIKMKYNERRNHFVVLAYEPENLISSSVIQKFHEVQDTQGLLYYFRQRLLNR